MPLKFSTSIAIHLQLEKNEFL